MKKQESSQKISPINQTRKRKKKAKVTRKIDQFTYCTQICGGKCCQLHFPGEDPIKCPNLNDNNSCGVYAKRYGSESPEPVVVVGYWETKKRKDINGLPIRMPFWCGRIKDIIATGSMKKEIQEQCCFAHPELLEQEVEER